MVCHLTHGVSSRTWCVIYLSPAISMATILVKFAPWVCMVTLIMPGLADIDVADGVVSASMRRGADGIDARA